MKRKMFAMLLSLAMLFTLAPTAFAVESGSGTPAMNGTCGAAGSESKVRWALTDNDEDGSYTLTISGNGAMANLNNSTETENISDGAGAGTYPWANLKDSITKIVIEDGVTSIGSKAFIAYTNVTSVSIGKDVSEIGVGALSQLSACTKFNVSSQNHNFMTDETGALFDDSQTKLIAFPCGSSVEEYAIPATVTVISYGAFSRAAHLKTITIPADSSLSTIGYGAFAFTTALETVNLIPASVETIGDIPFAQSGVKYIYCADKDTKDRIQNKVNGLLVDVLLPDETKAIEFEENGYTYRIDDGKALLVSAPKDVATPTVPSEVTYEKIKYPVTGIWKGAFAISLDWTEANYNADKRNEAITSVVLPASVTQIGERAFYFCKNLTTITVKSTKVSIDYLAFATQNSSTSGTTVDFSAVTTLQSNGTDKWAGVKTVILNKENQLDAIKSNVNPNTVAVIGSNKWVMGSDGNWTEQPKKNLTATVDNITWTFDAVGGKATLTAYSSKEATSVTVPSTLTTEDGVTYTVTELGKGLFGWDGNWDAIAGYNTSIKSVVIPKTVTTIGEDMFRYSQNLESVTIQGESVLFKNKRTFSGTNSLNVLDMSAVKTITFDSNVTSYFSNMGSNRSPAVIYVSSSAIKDAVEAHRPSTSTTTYLSYAITNDGTFKNLLTSNTGLATPLKDGYKFGGWYESADFSGNAVTAAPTAGQTYYAKWKEKTEKTAPAVPTLKDRTYTSITLNSIEGAQYRCNGGAWQTSPEFIGLTAGTTYTFEVYYPETDNYKASPASEKVEFSTLRHSSGSSSSNPTYSVTTPSKSENGKVSLDKSTAKKGDAVTVTVTPDAGYQLDKLIVTDKNGNVLKLTDKGDGKYSFTMPDGKVEVKAVFAKKVETSPFDDVSADAYYNQAVQWAQEKGITDGISSDLFGPEQPCTRSQIVTFLWRAAGSPEPKSTAAGMTDVVPGSYYAKAVAWAVENGITSGTAEGTFSPDATCTRAQAVTFLARAQNAKATGKTAFSDVPSDSYFADAVAWAQANGVTTGTSETTFSPDSDCTRAQIVTFLYRANQGT